MKTHYSRTVQRSNENSQTINIPKDISKMLNLDVGDIVFFVIKENTIELRKPQYDQMRKL